MTSSSSGLRRVFGAAAGTRRRRGRGRRRRRALPPSSPRLNAGRRFASPCLAPIIRSARPRARSSCSYVSAWISPLALTSNCSRRFASAMRVQMRARGPRWLA